MTLLITSLVIYLSKGLIFLTSLEINLFEEYTFLITSLGINFSEELTFLIQSLGINLSEELRNRRGRMVVGF